MSGTLIVVLIVVVWLLVLAPLLLRGQKPISSAGEAFEDTRVLFEGDSGELPETRRRPRLKARVGAGDEEEAAKTSHGDSASEHEVLVEDVITDHTPPRTSFKGMFTRLAPQRSTAKEADAHTEEQLREHGEHGEHGEYEEYGEHAKESQEGGEGQGDFAPSAEDTQPLRPTVHPVTESDLDIVEGEVVGEVIYEVEADAADQVDDEVTVPVNLVDTAAEEGADDAEGSVVASSPVELGLVEQDFQQEEEEDPYPLDESFVGPDDLLYVERGVRLAAVDASAAAEGSEHEQAHSSAAPVGPEGDLDTSKESGAEEEVAELSAEEIEFAQRRRGRGGFDPEADAASSLTRYQRRQRTLIALCTSVVILSLLAYVLGAWFWLLPAAGLLLTGAYLIGLRNQVRAERALRARRIRQLRRARLGVRSFADEELDIPRHLRRPGAVVLEMDDQSPDFEYLPLSEGYFDGDLHAVSHHRAG